MRMANARRRESWRPEERSNEREQMSETRDSNGALLNEGDNVSVIKDLKVKGSSTVLKRGTVIRGIHLTDDPEEIEGRTDKVKGLVLKTCFLKKA
jgi:protein PhnA